MMSMLVFVAIGYIVCGRGAAHSCRACFVAGEPGRRVRLAL